MPGAAPILAPMVSCRVLVATLLLLVSLTASAATQGTPLTVPLPLFPANNWWNLDVSNAPVDTNSAAYLPFMGGAGRELHPDFGGDDGEGGVYGFPYIVVDGSQTKKTVDFVLYPGQSDWGYDFIRLLEWLGLAWNIALPDSLGRRGALRWVAHETGTDSVPAVPARNAQGH